MHRRGRPWLSLVLVGGGLFGLHRLVRPPTAPGIEVRAGTVAALEADFAGREGRAPTEAELDGLIEDWVQQELLVREARAQGLDRADPIVRRRLAQKMRFVLEDAAPLDDPGDAVLQAWLDEHAAAYRRPPRRGFTHVFIAGTDEGSRALARDWVDRLRGGASPRGQGDAFAHGPRQGPVAIAAIARRYGEGLAEVVAAAPVGRWVLAPSSFGWHALRVDEERPGAVPDLDAVRARVLGDWRQQQRVEHRRRGLAALRERTRVTVER